MDFTDETVLRLINEYEKHPVLWDPADKFYKLNNKKKDAWNEIASVFGADADALKKKMNSVSNSYRRERQKVLSKTSGSRANEVGTSSWFAYDALGFLHNVYQPRQTSNVIESDGDSHEEMNYEISPRKRSQVNEFVSSKKPMKTKIPYDYEMATAWNSLQTSTDEKKNKDQFDSFGEYIAERLRQMDSNTCIHVKKAINDIIFEAELVNCSSVPLQQPPNVHLSWVSKQSPTYSHSPTSNTSQQSPTS